MAKGRVPLLVAAAAGAAWFIYYRIEEGKAGCCWPETFISSGVVMLLALPLAMSLFGRWHPFIGAIPAGLLGFALTAPTGCSHLIADGISDSYESLDCTSFVGLEFASYTTAEPAVDPPYWPAALVGLAVAVGFHLIAHAIRWRRTRSVLAGQPVHHDGAPDRT